MKNIRALLTLATFSIAIVASAQTSLFTNIRVTNNATFDARTATRVAFFGASGILADDADLTFATDTLTFTKGITTQFTNSGLTSGRVTFASTGGLLADSASLTFNSGTGTLTATTFSGAFSGTATNATNIGITDDTTTNATMYPVWVTTTTGNLPAKVASTKLSFNPSTGTLAATNHTGTFAGNTLTAGSSTYTGTAGQTYTMPTTSATLARTDAANTFTGTQTITTLAGVSTITGTTGNMTITAGTGNSRTLALQSTTSGGTATTFLTGNADQSTTFANAVSVPIGGSSTVPFGLQFGAFGTAVGVQAPVANQLSLANNVYYDGANWRYVTTAAAVAMELESGGTFTIYTIASGSAGAVAAVNSTNARIRSTVGGTILIGPSSDSSNGILQLPNATTITGGIGFGTGASIYSTSSGGAALRTNSTFTVDGLITASANVKSNGFTRITGDVTNATATMSNLTNLSVTVAAGEHYVGTMQIFGVDSVNTDGLAFDLGGGSCTFTDIEFGFSAQPAGSTLGTVTSTTATTAITLTVVSTSDAVYTVSFGFTVNAGGTFIPRFSQVTHTTGTATARKNSSMTLVNSTN